ncbi:MAG: hypothetical protein M1812_003383 [Candelaria pacifica]|nr:MAG: hypothetical protein M1812_003383 [Candelaria pacifica]
MKATFTPTMLLLVLLSLFATLAVGTAIPEAEPVPNPDASPQVAGSLALAGGPDPALSYWKFIIYPDEHGCDNNQDGVVVSGTETSVSCTLLPDESDSFPFAWKADYRGHCTIILFEDSRCRIEAGRSVDDDTACHVSHEDLEAYTVSC